MSDPVHRVGFFHPPFNPNGGGTVYVRPDEPAEDVPSPAADSSLEGRSAPGLLTQASEPEKVVEPAVAKAVENGHTVEWDAPAGISAVRRWTCTRCGDAVLDNRGHLYGGAFDRTCDESMEFWAEWR